MAILNYTTSISVNQTCNEIQKILVKAKASAVLCEFDSEGVISHIAFKVGTEHGEISFRLPSNANGVLKAIQREPKIPNNKKTKAHAERVAWRIIKDWLEAQLAIIEAGMATLPQVFLPYAQTPHGTVYECFQKNGPQFLLGRE